MLIYSLWNCYQSFFSLKKETIQGKLDCWNSKEEENIHEYINFKIFLTK